ncbi:MAG: outer membrane beta-barrel protein [Verrucomicrobia bacterium]|nr:outer membrane beta-barrel protein [Verrucomicrobiota bacterium]
MKKIIASTGLAALGAASLQGAYAPDLTSVQTAKPWSISAAVRGFYDDNYATRPSTLAPGTIPAGADARLYEKRGSWGMDLNPTASLNLPLEQTYIGLNYSYHMMYFQDRADLHEASADHVHQATATLSHQFSPHYSLDASDSFAVAQEPELLVPGYAPLPIFTRVNGNNIMNDAKAHFRGDLTDRLGAELSYDNTINIWDDHGYANSTASLLDIMNHMATADLRWTWLPTTVALLGYQFQYTDYTSSDPLTSPGGVNFAANVRNAQSHYAFVGVDQTFTTKLSASVRVGAEYTTYPNAPAGSVGNTTSPYADANLTYTYNPGSYVKVGVTHQRNPTYLGFIGTNIPLMDSEATAVYAMVNHKITGKLSGNILGSYQNSNYHVPGAADMQDNFFNANVGLTYQINQFLAAETSYNYYRLDSDLPYTSYTRNLVFFGLRATY